MIYSMCIMCVYLNNVNAQVKITANLSCCKYFFRQTLIFESVYVHAFVMCVT